LLSTVVYAWQDGEVLESAPGVSGGWNPDPPVVTQDQSSATFQLSGLPEHATIIVDVAFENWGAWGEGDSEEHTLTISGGPTENYTFTPDDVSDWGVYAQYAHTSEQL
jgi:hypothetical protein